MNSIRLRLLRWLIVPILLINLAGASLTYMLAWVPAQQAFDQGLVDATLALAARMGVLEGGGPGSAAIGLPTEAEQVLRANEVDAVYFAVRTTGGRLLAGDADFPVRTPAAGAFDDSMRGEPVRLYLRSVMVGGETVRIGVAKTLRKRAQTRAAIVRALVLLETLLVSALVGMIWFSVSAGLQPLRRVRMTLEQRAIGDVAPIDTAQVPDEVIPVVAGFNELLGQLQSGAKAQQDFLADMAHQLRTPLAGIKLQLEWLGARHASDEDTVHSLRLMLQANERMIRHSNQLLALARAEPSRFVKARLERTDLADLVREAIQVFASAAARKQIDIGFELSPARLAGDPGLLRDLIDNLIDNAVRYTPPGGSVTVRVAAPLGAAMLVVEDSGPGIAPRHRSEVFDRFVRLDDKVPGSGLGLAIVRDIVAAHGAEIGIGGEPGQGAVFTVLFPRPGTK
jgi:two-component system sensor histidine kinase TctE